MLNVSVCTQCFADRSADIGSAPGNQIRIEGGERLLKDGAVQRHRALQERIARESDDARSVACEFPDQITHGQFRSAEAVRRQIVGGHAARGVDGEQDVEPLALGLFEVRTPPWSRRCDKEAHHPDGQKRNFGRASPRRKARRELCARLCETPKGTPVSPRCESDQCQECDHSACADGEPKGFGKVKICETGKARVHGILRKSAKRPRSSTKTSPIAGNKKRPNRSW